MPKPPQRRAVLILMLGLAGCGGGGGGSVVSVPAPPPAAPAPPPPDSASIPFRTPGAVHATAGTATDGDLAAVSGPRGTLLVTGFSPGTPPYVQTIALQYVGPDRYELSWDFIGDFPFNEADRFPSEGPFEVYRRPGAVLEIAKPEPLQLAYSSLGNFALDYEVPHANGVGDTVGFFAVGSTTPSSQLPTSGRARYSGVADGLWIDGATVRRLFGSTAVLEADFATGNVISTLNLIGRDDPFGDFAAAAPTTLGQFIGTGRMSEPADARFRFYNNFTGNYAAAAGYTGSFSGQFYGPGAIEVGLGFRMTGRPGQIVFGAAAGRRE